MSAIVIHNGVAYLAGQTGLTEAGAPKTLREQAEVMLDKVDALLKEAGSSRSHMLRAEIFLRDAKDFTAFNEIWDSWIPEGHAPARSCLQAAIPRQDDLLCELIVTAAVR
jgi:enamine deaminase RidA (YjgF/YER057c/UK114 family)